MRIEFYLTTALEVSHFAPIVRALMELEQDVSFISPQTTPKTTMFGWDDADLTEMLLRSLDLPWTKHPDFGADCVLTIQPEDMVSPYRHTKMRMTYGVGLVPPATITNSNRPFDYHLVHGSFNQRVQFRYHALASPMLPDDRVKVIGYPRFDDWFKAPKTIRDLWEKNTERPVLLWLPTWGRASSIDRYFDAIAALSDKYDIWVKPHHGTVHWEKERMDKLRNGRMKLLRFTDPPEPSFAAASVVLADLASGAFTEAVFLGKKVIGLTTEDEAHRTLEDTDMAIEFRKQINPEGCWVASDQTRAKFVDSTEGADGMRAAKIIVECLNDNC